MTEPVHHLPHVAVIVPVAGSAAGLEQHLRSLMQQEYPAFEIIFVTENDEDPAVPIIEKVLAGNSRGRRIRAGRSAACSQKNHNLLAGVRAVPEATEILVFCDAGHHAQPQWLQRLIRPLHDSSAVVSSGYHHVFPEKGSIPSTGRAICVLGLWMLRRVPALTQPWGGSMAVRKNDFFRLDIAQCWSTTIVDDVTLADLLHKRRLHVAIPDDADLLTEVRGDTWLAWQTWLIRQWAYLKFLYPRLWLAAGLATIALTLLVYGSMAVVIAWGSAAFPDRLKLVAATAVLAVVFAAVLSRLRHPAPSPLHIWLPGFMAALTMAAWCHCRTWFSDSITWAGIVYEVGAGGKVASISRPGEQRHQDTRR